MNGYRRWTRRKQKTYTPLYTVCTLKIKAQESIYKDLSLTHTRIDMIFTLYSVMAPLLVTYAKKFTFRYG